MASINRTRVGTVGVDIELDTKIDLTAFSTGTATVGMDVRQPNGVLTTWSAVFKDGDPTNGILVHTLVTGDVDQEGDYLISAHVTAPDAIPPVDTTGLSFMTLTTLGTFKAIL